MDQKAWKAYMLNLGRYRENPAACFIPSCFNNSSVALRAIQSGSVAFYCSVCAMDLLGTDLFVQVPVRKA